VVTHNAGATFRIQTRLHDLGNRSGVLSAPRFDGYHSLVNAGEFVVAWEILCANVGDNKYGDAGVLPDVAKDLTALCESLGVDPK
jgi:hypothetical protein